MAINLKFDLLGNPEPPSIVLANRNGNKLGQLNVNVESIDVSDKFNAASEFSFTLNKYIEDEPTPLWDKVVDFKLVYCPEWDLWFEIKVELDETTETVKTVFCTQLGQAELSQIKVYNVHINEEGDPNWDTNNEAYKSTILYDPQNTDVSLLHRLLKDKAPHYSIAYVDESIQRIQKTFSFDDTSICDAFNEIAEEIGCLFVYNSNSTKGGKPNRTISVYDLQQNCLNPNCKHRGEFADVCPKCNSQDNEGNKYGIKYGYGEDTTIFVTSDELATEGIQLVTDTDAVKNCFKLEGGDDLMTATIRNCNPNGSDYIWYFSDALKEDMSTELVEKLESYDETYERYYKTESYKLNENAVSQYNELVDRYSKFYNTKSTCLSCETEGYFYDQCSNSSCHSKNILTGKKLQTIDSTITGYPALMTAYYNTIDLSLYLESGLMPNVEIGEKSLCLNCNHEGVFANACSECNSTNILSGAKYQLNLLNTTFPSAVAVNVDKVKDVTLSTANSAVLSMAKTIVKSTYKVEVLDDSSLQNREFDNGGNVLNKTWTGKFKITNYSDEDDCATSEEEIEVIVNNDTKKFVEQKINKALNKENTDDYSVVGLFAKELNVNESGEHILDENGVCQGAETINENGDPVCPFCAELKKYALNPLVNFSKVCDGVISILTEQGVGDDGGNIVVNNEDDEIEKATKQELYNQLYKPYFEKQQAINKEIAIRENEIAIIEGVWDKSDESNPKCTTNGLQQYIEECQQDIQEALNFEKHLGENLWLEFCAYRREDNYSNSNYVSDGLNNAELFDRALEFIEVAEEEIFKSAELQHSISATLNNLLSLPKFKPLLKSFKTGNWIRVQVDGKIYKLRLLEYGFGYGDSKSISVEFSDVTKIKNGVTDVKEVLEQASSMASSYDSVQRQAEKGNVARSTIDQWLIDGLNTANVQIASNDSEEVLLTKSGLLARSYDDITGTYSPEQFKLTHNIMAYTDDNWKTVSSALGKHDYKKWENNQWVTDTDYGLSSKFVTAGYVIGSQIIGGEIVSSNYKIGDEAVGTYINLINGNFSFAGGKMIYEYDPSTNKNNLILSGVEIKWDKVNKPTVENIDGLSGITEDIRAIEQGLQATTINGQYVISPHIVGGDLKIVGDNGANAQISNTGVLTATGANITGDITATSLTLGNGVKISTDNIDGIDEYAKIGDIEGVPDNIITTDDIAISESTTANGVTTQKITVGDTEYTNIISGDFVFTDIGLGTDTTDGSQRYICISRDGLLTAKNAIVYGTVYATDGKFSGDIEADSLTLREDIRLGNDADGYHTWISKDGILSTENANISGEIRAPKGQIGGFTIEPTETTDGEIKSGGWLYSGEYIGANKSIFLSATNMSGTVSNTEKTNWRVAVGENFGIIEDGTAYMSNCEITGGSLRMGTESDGYYTWISEDGMLNAQGVNISGEVNAVKGNVAGWQITNDALYKNISGISSGMCSVNAATTTLATDGLRYELNADGTEYSVIDYEGEDTVVYIPSEYESLAVTSINLNAFFGCTSITRVVIPDSVTSIGKYAFSNCSSLTDVMIGGTVASIGAFAFEHCSSLISIIIPSSVTSIGSSAFYQCNNLTIYCEAESQPDGWVFGWDSDCNVVWGCTPASNIPSLVVDGEFSPVRFFAGSKYNIPHFSDDAKFLVLEDGSLYASSVDIKGKINAIDGEIGGLTLKDYSLTTNNFSILNDNTENGVETEVILKGLLSTTYCNVERLSTTTATLGDVSINDSLIIGSLQISNNGVLSCSAAKIDMSSSSGENTKEYTISFTREGLSAGNDFALSIEPIPTTNITCLFTYESAWSGERVTDSCTFNSTKTTHYVSSGWFWGTKNETIIMVNGEATLAGAKDNVTVIVSNDANITITGNMIPSDSNKYALGNEDFWWSGAYLGSSDIITSDKNAKNSIKNISEPYGAIFDSLIPVSYKYNDGTSNRTHTGFIAQDVKAAIENAGLTTQDFAAYCDWSNKDGSTGCALRYEEFIALCVNEIQKLKKRVIELESKVENN